MERKSQRKCLFIRIKKVSILFVWRLKRMLSVRGLDELTSVEVGVSSFARIIRQRMQGAGPACVPPVRTLERALR